MDRRAEVRRPAEQRRHPTADGITPAHRRDLITRRVSGADWTERDDRIAPVLDEAGEWPLHLSV